GEGQYPRTQSDRKRLQDRDRKSEARSATPIATGTAMKTNIVTVRAMPSASTAQSAMRMVMAANTRAPTSQALHPRPTVVLPLREITIIKRPPQAASFYTAGQPPARAATLNIDAGCA